MITKKRKTRKTNFEKSIDNTYKFNKNDKPITDILKVFLNKM